MRVVSINLGLPRTVEWHGARVTTGIFKEPVEGSVPLRKLNFDGDRQADLTVHGGVHKAVYAYPVEHYPKWKVGLPTLDFPYGAFGENLTVEGFSEASLFLGDRSRIGSAVLQVTQPRLPCYKLGVRFGRDDMTKLFLASGRSVFSAGGWTRDASPPMWFVGLYYAVIGEAGAPQRQTVFALGEQLPDQAAECLRERTVRDVPHDLIEFAGDEVTPLPDDRLVQLVDQ